MGPTGRHGRGPGGWSILPALRYRRRRDHRRLPELFDREATLAQEEVFPDDARAHG